MKVVILSSLLLLLSGLGAIEECVNPTAVEYSCPRRSAPGDFDPSCRTGFVEAPKHIFPENWRVLFDNYDYFFLFEFGSWVSADFDGNNLQVCVFNIPVVISCLMHVQ